MPIAPGLPENPSTTDLRAAAGLREYPLGTPDQPSFLDQQIGKVEAALESVRGMGQRAERLADRIFGTIPSVGDKGQDCLEPSHQADILSGRLEVLHETLDGLSAQIERLERL